MKTSLCTAVVVLLSSVVASSATASDPFLARRARAILTANCIDCHGPDAETRKGGLRLDDRDAALTGGDTGSPAIVPKLPAESELLIRVTSTDAHTVMPPPRTNRKLSAEEVETLQKWMESGAEYSPHWAFVAPEKVTPPGSGSAIDGFIDAGIRHAGLAPGPRADRAALLRRWSLDLTGLPPTIAELDAYLADQSPNADDRQIERLLASPRFGEKWARHWLDVARYADSDGYEKDVPRSQWAYRDWVIAALNADMPFDRFLVEQLAGDLLPNPTQDQLVATGFLRNGMVNEEGAIVFEQFRMEGIWDRLDVLGKGVLGLTIQCAQCHSHKFDPLTQTEYYGLMSFINNDYEATIRVHSPDQLATIDRLKTEQAALTQQLQTQTPDFRDRMAAWERDLAAQPLPAWSVLDCTEHEWVGGLAHPGKLPDGSILTLGFRPSIGELYCVAETSLAQPTGLRLEALTHGDLPFGGPGRSYRGQFAVSELTVEAQPLSGGDWKPVPLQNATADFALPEQQIDPELRRSGDDKRKIGPAAFLIDNVEDTAWSSDRGAGRRNTESQAVIQFGAFDWPADGVRLKVWLKFRHAGGDIHGRHNNFLGRFRLSLTDSPAPVADLIPVAVRRVLARPTDQRTDEDVDTVFQYWRTTVADFAAVNSAIENTWTQYPEPATSVLALKKREPEFTRTTYILDRGAWDQPTTPVAANVPAFLHPLSEDLRDPATGGPKSPDRLTLARWLTDRRSPTTARVFVNRVWQTMFGQGLVDTPDDLGVRAPEPTHPELLDWLAVDFMDRGWSLKQLLRTIVTSQAYQRSSAISQEGLEKDPGNRWLARGPRFRADAEVVRDVALASSGLLNERLGGPSFFPPVPPGTFALSYLKVDFWDVAPAPERYRRSLYMFRRRSMPDPALSAFDAPAGDVSCPKRIRSNTPLAALTSLNEPVFIEAARAMAGRILREGGSTDPERAAYAIRLCTSRIAKPSEIDVILSLIESQKARIADGWLAPYLITTGDGNAKPELPPNATPAQLAVWTLVSRVLLNLDETVTRN